MALPTMSPTCATWSMPMNASTSGMSLGSSSRNRCGRQPETMTAWPRWFASRSSTDSRMVSTLSSCAESMKEQVLTMMASALRGVVGDFDAAFQERAEHDLGVHQIFGAAERNQADAQRLGTGIFLRHSKNQLTRNGAGRSQKLFHGRAGATALVGMALVETFSTALVAVFAGRKQVGGQAQFGDQFGAGGIRHAVFRVEQLPDYGGIQRVERRQRDARLAAGAGGFGRISLIDPDGEALEIFVAVVLTGGEGIIGARSAGPARRRSRVPARFRQCQSAPRPRRIHPASDFSAVNPAGFQ